MSATKTAPDCCQFCGAGLDIKLGGKPAKGVLGDWARFTCGTFWFVGDAENERREIQEPRCATTERERLTRERDEARAVLMDPQALWINICRGTVTLPKGIGDVRQWQDRVKQLESDWSGWPDLQREWFGDKYAAMQPLEAVRARIEDSEARVKSLEFLLGQWVRKHERVYVAGGWDYDKEGVAMMDASKVLLGITAKGAKP